MGRRMPMKEVYTFEELTDWKRVTADENPPLRLAVLGDPVAHSASPPMHNAALAACGIDARYCRLHVQADELEEALQLLWEKGFIGVNCTIPHKLNALAAVDDADEDANRAGGVNTIVVGPGGRLKGSSTDGAGLVRALKEEFDVELQDLRVLVLGAGGGAGRAVAKQCAYSGARRLILINRSPEKLQPLHDTIVETYPRERLFVCPWEEPALAAALDHADLVVNCSSVGMKPGDPSPARICSSTPFTPRNAPRSCSPPTLSAPAPRTACPCSCTRERFPSKSGSIAQRLWRRCDRLCSNRWRGDGNDDRENFGLQISDWLAPFRGRSLNFYFAGRGCLRV